MGAALVAALWVKPAKGAAMRGVPAVTLAAGGGVHGDCGADARSARQVLVVSNETVRSLGGAPGDLRENVTVTGLDVDSLPSGAALRVGSAVLRVTYPCEPCARLRLYSSVDPRAAVGRRGVLAVVVSSGAAGRGDTVAVENSRAYAPLPHGRLDRLRWFLRRAPRGVVVTYGELAAAVAAPPGGARSLPRALASLALEGLPAHRAVPAGLHGVSAGQRARLADEGVDVGGTVVWWSPAGLLYEPAPVRRAVTPLV